jgi:hypothetical protein
MTRLQSVFLLLAAAGCSTPHMVVPGDIAGSEMIEVTERSSFSGALVDESFKLGPYDISDVDRDWKSTRTVDVLGFESSKTGSGYAFHFKHKGSDIEAGCFTESGTDSASLGMGISVSSTFAKLGCTCGGSDSEVKVVVGAKTDKEYTGELVTSKGKYFITALYEAEGVLSNGDPTGYRVDGSSAIGAVEVLRPGRAYFTKGLDQQEHADLACLYAGLMLYEAPKDDK